MLTNSAKKLNDTILRNLQQERAYCLAKGNAERLEILDAAIKQHKKMIEEDDECEGRN